MPDSKAALWMIIALTYTTIKNFLETLEDIDQEYSLKDTYKDYWIQSNENNPFKFKIGVISNTWCNFINSIDSYNNYFYWISNIFKLV